MGHGYGFCGLRVFHTPNAQDRRSIVRFDADAIILAKDNSLGIENRGSGKLAVGSDGTFPIGDNGDGTLFIDDQPAGELVVYIGNVYGNLHGVLLVLVEECKQLLHARSGCPEGDLLAVDVDCRLVCALYANHIMIGQIVA